MPRKEVKSAGRAMRMVPGLKHAVDTATKMRGGSEGRQLPRVPAGVRTQEDPISSSAYEKRLMERARKRSPNYYQP